MNQSESQEESILFSLAPYVEEWETRGYRVSTHFMDYASSGDCKCAGDKGSPYILILNFLIFTVTGIYSRFDILAIDW